MRDDNAIFLILIIQRGEFYGNGLVGFLNNIAADGAVKYLINIAVRRFGILARLQQSERSFPIRFVADGESLQALNIAYIRLITGLVNGYAVII